MAGMSTHPRPLLRPAAERFHSRIGWLDSWHSFSFGEHYDPEWTGWNGLVVVNDDIIREGSGFGEHGHRDMAIITWVLSGELQHRDSLGNGGVLRAGDTQVMQAGRGIRHSEFNPSTTEPLHLFQSWVLPVANGLPPTYDQRSVPVDERRDRWAVLADRDGSKGGLVLGADAVVATAVISPGKTLSRTVEAGRAAWVQVCRGSGRIGDQALIAGDGLGLGAGDFTIAADEDLEVLVFDLGDRGD